MTEAMVKHETQVSIIRIIVIVILVVGFSLLIGVFVSETMREAKGHLDWYMKSHK